MSPGGLRPAARAPLRGLAVLLLLAALPGPAASRPARHSRHAPVVTPGARALPTQQEVDRQRSEYEQLQKKAKEKRQAAQQLKKKETGVLRQLRQIEINLSAAKKAVQAYTERETRLARDISIVERDLGQTRTAREMTRQQLARRLRSAYRFREDRELEILLSARSFAELELRMHWMGLVAHQDERLIGRLGAQAESIDVARVLLERKKTEITTVRSEKEQEKRKMEALRGQRQKSVQQIQSTRLSFESAAAELERSARHIKDLLDELERRRLEEERRMAQRGQKVPEGQFGHGRGSLPWPVRGTILENFGPNRHPKFNTVTMNNGIDIGAPEGAEIHSVEKGVVEYVDWYEGYGQTILINHGGGFYTLYAHCSTVAVTQGQQVASGQVIGKVGDTGSLRGTELHFEVRKGKTAVDPLDWLR